MRRRGRGPLLYPVRVLGEVGVVGYGVGLLCVVEVVTSGMCELRGDGCDEGGGGALFDGFVGEDAGGFGGVERFPLLGGEVSLQSGRDTAGVDGVGDDAVGVPQAGRFDGEEGVRGLGLGVGDLGVVAATLEVQVVEVDAGAHVCRRAERYDPRSVPLDCPERQRVMETGGQGEVAEVVGDELQLPACGGSFEAVGDEPGVVDEQVKRAIPCFGEVADRVPAARSSRRTRGRMARVDVSMSSATVTPASVLRTARVTCAPAAVSARGFGPEAGRGSRHDRADAAEVDALEHVGCGAGRGERC